MTKITDLLAVIKVAHPHSQAPMDAQTMSASALKETPPQPKITNNFKYIRSFL